MTRRYLRRAENADRIADALALAIVAIIALAAFIWWMETSI